MFLVCKNAQIQKQAKSPEKPDTARDAARFLRVRKSAHFCQKTHFFDIKNHSGQTWRGLQTS
ncbi:hypothetical protein AA14_05875 [Salmonella enterica]|uniref:Uncharacterized protein n=1 Tax=Salmonella enterica I TaxID=59201 RepID=A0A7Z1Q5A8_SALET|nr:hypothetical protein [Salmonella enterica]ECG0832439.1 hypothetical protein [Salmonella enterica subsp. diarizonae]ECW2473954.1 hypothetical protein [Salmonella enterica subsp. enterica serovar Florida]PUF40043.1 hypothetical protein DAX92_06340 [Salmonella enterica subsp. enterica]EAN2611024.1 hypothetical protein [Salmonella enterica]